MLDVVPKQMNTSVIRQRVADFLKVHPPFDSISDADLLNLAGCGRVKFHESEEYIFRQGDAPGQFVWVVQQGRVELVEENGSGERLRDVLGEGDLLGLERFADAEPPPYSARTASDVILYALTAEAFDALVEKYPHLRIFVASRSSSAQDGAKRTSWLDAEFPPSGFLHARLATLPSGASIEDARALISDMDSGVVALIDGAGRFQGVLTLAGLCKPGAGDVIERAQSCPVASAPLTTRGAVRAMLPAGAEHLAIAGAGGAAPLEALLTASDLALFTGQNPMRIAAAIRRASSTVELMTLRRQAERCVLAALASPGDTGDCCMIAAELAKAAAEACIRLARNDVLETGRDVPPVAHCVAAFGAAARADRLHIELPMLAVIYDESDPHFDARHTLYFSALAARVAARLQDAGFSDGESAWPRGSQAAMALSDWRRLFTETIQQPAWHQIYARRQFLDSIHCSGDATLLRQLHDTIQSEFRANPSTTALLANDTLAHLPPMTFFRGLVLDLDGEQRDSFDIDTTALSPIADAARVFALGGGRTGSPNTLFRLEGAAHDYPQHAAVFHDAGEAFRTAIYFRALAGSPEIHARTLQKTEQLILKRALSSIHRLLEVTQAVFFPGLD